MTRNSQIVHPGLGKNYQTPQKPGRTRRLRDSLVVPRPGRDAKRRELLKKLRDLDEKRAAVEDIDNSDPFADDSLGVPMEEESNWVDEEPMTVSTPSPSPRKRKPRNLNQDVEKQYTRWKQILPSLVTPLLAFISASSGKATPGDIEMPPCTLCNQN